MSDPKTDSKTGLSTDYIWKKGDSASAEKTDRQLQQKVMRFLAGEDVLLDRELIHYDCKASRAHIWGLHHIGVLTTDEFNALDQGLEQIAGELKEGTLTLDERFEDGHSALESWLTERLGEVGGKVHTGRSRNDQVAVALRLYLKDRLGSLAQTCMAIAATALERATREAEIPMPGYTHLQRAMPSSVGFWLAGHAEAFIDNAELALQTRQWLDACPLGTASGFGVNLPLPRQQVSDQLGFSRLVVNPQYAQNSRGKLELQAIAALSAATGDLRRLAWDLSLFTTSEFAFCRLGEAWCTGSSIMPNKRNPDSVELLRAVHAVVIGARAELESVLSLPSGYQRDLQATKPPLLRAFTSGLSALELVPALVEAIQWDESAMDDAIDPDLFATDLSLQLAVEGMPFRQAYREAAHRLGSMEAVDVAQSLAQRVSPGGAGNLLLDQLQARLARLKK